MTVKSDLVSPVRPIGSNVTLTCTVELSPAVDVPVTVNTVWTGPAGCMSNNTAQPVMGSTTTYTSTAIVSSFGRDQSGSYTCTATVSSVSPFITNSSLSDIKSVTTGNIRLQLTSSTYNVNNNYHITFSYATLCRCLSLFQGNPYSK